MRWCLGSKLREVATMLTCVLPQRIKPFLSLLSQSQNGLGVLVFNLKHPLTLSPSSRFRGGETCRLREVSGFGAVSGEKRQKRKGQWGSWVRVFAEGHLGTPPRVPLFSSVWLRLTLSPRAARQCALCAQVTLVNARKLTVLFPKGLGPDIKSN